MEADQPEGGPKALARWKPGSHFEVPELLRKAFALPIDGRQQPAAPLPIRAFGGFDAELAVLHSEWKTRIRIGEGRAPKVAIPRRVGDPARSRSPRGHIQRVKILAEGLYEIREIEFVAGVGAPARRQSSQNKKEQKNSRKHVNASYPKEEGLRPERTIAIQGGDVMYRYRRLDRSGPIMQWAVDMQTGNGKGRAACPAS